MPGARCAQCTPAWAALPMTWPVVNAPAILSSYSYAVLVRVDDARGFCLVMWFHRFGESPPCWEGVSQGRARACDGRPEPCYSGSTYYKKVLPPKKNHLLHPRIGGWVAAECSRHQFVQPEGHACCLCISALCPNTHSNPTNVISFVFFPTFSLQAWMAVTRCCSCSYSWT